MRAGNSNERRLALVGKMGERCENKKTKLKQAIR